MSEYVVFGANPLADDGYGKGVGSLNAIVEAAGLAVVSEARYDHPRGYVLVARGEQPGRSEEEAPLERLISKYFLPAALGAEKEFADALADGREPDSTRYFRLRTGATDWHEQGVARLPENLDVEPVYWIVPWSAKPRRSDPGETEARRRTFPELAERFGGLVASLRKSGFDPSLGRVRAYKLVHPEHGAVYQYVDGNQRVGALAHLAEREPGRFERVPVLVEGEIRRERLLDYPLTRQLVEEGRFTEADVYRWFDQAFLFLAGRET